MSDIPHPKYDYKPIGCTFEETTRKIKYTKIKTNQESHKQPLKRAIHDAVYPKIGEYKFMEKQI